MIEVYVNNTQLYLAPDAKLKLTLQFPTPGEIYGQYIEWFSFPANDYNSRIFSFNNKRHIKRIDTFSCIVKIGDIQLSGKMVVKKTTHKIYKAFIVFMSIDDIKDKKLNELIDETIDPGSDTDTIVDFANQKNQTASDDNVIAFPQIKNGDFYKEQEDLTLHYLYIVNNYDIASNSILRNTYHRNSTALVPYLYLTQMLKKAFESADYNPVGNFFTDDSIRQVIVHNNYEIAGNNKTEKYIVKWALQNYSDKDPAGDMQELPLILIEDKDNIASGSSTQNFYEVQKICAYKFRLKIKLSLADTGSDAKEYLRIYVIGYYSRNVQAEHSVSILPGDTIYYDDVVIFEPHKDASIGDTWSIYKMPSVDATFTIDDLEIIFSPVGWINHNEFLDNIDLNNHVPRISLSDCVKNLSTYYTLAVFFDLFSKEVAFEFLNDIISSNDVIDLTDASISETLEKDLTEKDKEEFSLSFDNDNEIVIDDVSEDYTVYATYDDLPEAYYRKGEVAYITNLNAYYKVMMNEEGWLEWQNYVDGHSDQGDGIGIGTLAMRKDRAEIMPAVQQKGSGDFFELGFNEPGFKLLFYTGMQTDDINLTYPLATSTYYDLKSNKLSLNHQHKWYGEGGLYETFRKKWDEYKSERTEITERFKLDIIQLKKILNLYRANSHVRKVRVENQNYIPLKFEIEIGKNIETCKAKLL